MAQSLIQIKRSTGESVPRLHPGELAYSAAAKTFDAGSNARGVLFIGSPELGEDGYAASTLKIGGRFYTSLLDVATPGTVEANKAVVADAKGAVQSLTVTDSVKAGSLVGHTDDVSHETTLVIGIPDQPNQKTIIYDPYVTNEEGENVPLKEFVDGYVKSGITLTAGDGIAEIVNDDSGSFTIALKPIEGLSAGKYGSQTKIPSFTVNQYGQITEVSESNISTVLNITNTEGNQNSTVDLLSGKLTIGDGLKFTSETSNTTVTVDESVIRTTGDQTINGTKTFGDTIPVVTPEQTLESDGSQVTKLSTLQDEIKYTDESATGATVAVGGIAKGEKLTDMTFKEVIEKLLHPYVATTNVRLTASPVNGGTFEVGDVKTITGGTVAWTAGSTQVGTAEILKSGSPIGSASVSSGTSVAVTLTEAEQIGSTAGTVSLSCRVKDDGNSKTINGGSVSFTHVYPFYYGVADSADAATGTAVASMTKIVQAKGNKTFAFTANNQVCVIAYPASYGNLSKVLDQNNFDVTSTFVKKTDNVTGLDGTAQSYNIYTNAASTLSGFKFTFSF